ncbi:MAG: Uma2 family endonuclease [Isosphaerales bacterium]
MSTVPRRSSPSDTKPSFRYGYREVRVKQPNGRVKFKRVPLTLRDVLHPRFGDVHVLSDPHADDCNYLRSVLKDRYAADRSVAVFSDCGIFWDVPRLGHHSPDLSVIFGVKQRKDWKTFDVKEEKVRPRLIIEVTSPSTRVNDVKTKVKQYATAGVPHYVIADAEENNNRRRLTLIAYRLAGESFVSVPLDEHGRAWLDPVGLWLAVKVYPETGGDRLVLVDPSAGQEIGDYTAIRRTLAAETEARARAEAQVEAALQARSRAVAQVQAAFQARAQAEAEARAAEERARAAEDRLRQLEAELKRRGRGKSS